MADSNGVTTQPTSGSPSVALRRLQSGDEKPVHELPSDEHVTRYMLFPRFTIEQAKNFVERFQERDPAASPPQVVRAIHDLGRPRLIELCGIAAQR